MHAVTVDKQPRGRRHRTGLCLEFRPRHHPHRACGFQARRRRAGGRIAFEKQRVGVAAAGPRQIPLRAIEDAVPDREALVAVGLHRKRVVQGGKDLAGDAKIGVRQRARAEHVHDRDREQRRIEAVPRHIDQIQRQVVGIEPMIAETVAPKIGGGNVAPVGAHRLLRRRGEQGLHVLLGRVHLLGQALPALGKSGVGLVALQQANVALRMVADARQQFDLIGQLDQVVIRSPANASAFTVGSSLVDRTISGVSRVPGLARKNFTSVMPSISGMTRSWRMTVGCTRLAVSRALVGSAQ